MPDASHPTPCKNRAQPPKLSQRELDVLNYVGRGYTNKAIGLQLDISPRTVQTHLARIYRKLDVNSRTEAVMQAVSLGYIEQPTK